MTYMRLTASVRAMRSPPSTLANSGDTRITVFRPDIACQIDAKSMKQCP